MGFVTEEEFNRRKAAGIFISFNTTSITNGR